MKCACPACGRRTEVEKELGDFPMHCQRCGALLRPPVAGEIGVTTPKGRPVFAAAGIQGRPERVPPGTLVTLLTARRDPAKEVGVAGETARTDVERPPRRTPENVIARVQSRQKAMRRAQLTGKLQSLATVGVLLVAILGVAAAVMGFKSVWGHPRTSRAEGGSSFIMDGPAGR